MAELLSADEAQRIGLNFLQGIYYRGKVTINEIRLVSEDAFPVYHLEGSIAMSSRSALGRLIYSEAPYTLKMQIHALEGSVLNYEVR